MGLRACWGATGLIKQTEPVWFKWTRSVWYRVYIGEGPVFPSFLPLPSLSTSSLSLNSLVSLSQFVFSDRKVRGFGGGWPAGTAAPPRRNPKLIFLFFLFSTLHSSSLLLFFFTQNSQIVTTTAYIYKQINEIKLPLFPIRFGLFTVWNGAVLCYVTSISAACAYLNRVVFACEGFGWLGLPCGFTWPMFLIVNFRPRFNVCRLLLL